MNWARVKRLRRAVASIVNVFADAQKWREQEKLVSETMIDAAEAAKEFRESGLVRYQWRDARGRHCTSFVPPEVLAAVEVAETAERLREAEHAVGEDIGRVEAGGEITAKSYEISDDERAAEKAHLDALGRYKAAKARTAPERVE